MVKLCQCPQRASTYFFRVFIPPILEQKKCQCPQRASTYFFKIKEDQNSRMHKVSMPSTGFYLFLLGIIFQLKLAKKLCQCPQRASTYFFEITNITLIAISTACQCPQRASTYFSFHDKNNEHKQECVNALNGLLLISSIYMMEKMAGGCHCVNALNGLLLISSLKHSDKRRRKIANVSMPSTGFYLFLQ